MRTWRDFYRVTHPQLRELMTGLYYPAVLGAGIVFLLLLFSHTHPLSDTLWDFRFWFGFLFSLFFSFSYFTILQAPGANYNFGTFALDLVESILIFCAFGSLGLYETPPEEPHRATAYGLFIAVIVIENIWSWVLGRASLFKIGLSVFAVIVLTLAAKSWHHSAWGNGLTLLILYILFAIDVWYSFKTSTTAT